MIKVIVLSPHTFSMASIIIQTNLVLGLTWPVQTAGERSLVVNIYSTMCSKVILCKIPMIWGRPSTTFLNYPRSGIWKIIHPCCWYHHTLYFKSYRIYQARYPVTHVTQAGKLRSRQCTPGHKMHWIPSLHSDNNQSKSTFVIFRSLEAN